MPSGVFTSFDLVPHDVHIIITVGSGLLVPQTQSVQELVLHSCELITVAAY